VLNLELDTCHFGLPTTALSVRNPTAGKVFPQPVHISVNLRDP
jgi:hypothetical protein